MGFEVFIRAAGMRRGNSLPHISILKTGSFSINRACMDAFLKDVTYTQLLFDHDARRIGLKPVAPDSGNSFKISRSKSGSGSIAARLFLSHYGVEYSTTQRLKAEWDESMQAVVVSLA